MSHSIKILALLLLSTLGVHAQQIDFNHTDLNTLFQELESKSNYTFNYDPQLIGEYSYDGPIDLADLEVELSKVLQKTPLTFEHIDNNFMLMLADKQKYNICGWIKDKTYNSKLIGANIYADGVDVGTLTDESGYFELAVSSYKNQSITISYIGYISQEFILGTLPNDDGCFDYYLAHDKDILGSEIVITDYIHPGISEGESYSSTKMDYTKTLNATANDEHDVLKAVQILPGVTSLDESAGNLNIRGSTPDQNMLVWEGATLYNSGHLFGMISSVNPFVLDEVNIYKGVFDPSYDNRIGGLIDMSLPDLIPNKFHAGLGSTLSEGHIHISTPIIKNKLGIVMSARSSINKVINSPTINRYTDKVFQLTKFDTELSDEEKSYRDDEDLVDFIDANIKVFFQPTDKLSFTSSFLSSSNLFENYSRISETQTSDYVAEDTWAWSSKLQYKWKPGFKTNLFVIASNYNFHYNSSQVGIIQDPSEDDDEYIMTDIYYDNLTSNYIEDLTVGITNSIDINHRSNIRADLDFDFKLLNHNYQEYSEFEPSVVRQGSGNGFFTNLSVAYDYTADRLQLMLGNKISYYQSGVVEPFLSPRFNLQYLIKPDLKLKLSGGKLYQFISQVTLNDENDLGSLRNFWVMADENSDEIMNSNKLSLGVIGNKNGWLYDIETYYNRNFGLASVSANLNAGVELDESGESTAIGVEMLLKKRWNNYNLWLNYTLSYNEYFFPDTNMDPFPANNDHRHNISLVNNYDYKNFSFMLNYNFRSGLPYSKPSGINSTYIDGEPEYSLQFDQLNNKRLRPYHRFDASISYRKLLLGKINLEANLSLINLLNTRNVYTTNSYLIPEDDATDVPSLVSYDKILLRRTPKFLLRFYF